MIPIQSLEKRMITIADNLKKYDKIDGNLHSCLEARAWIYLPFFSWSLIFTKFEYK
jgi:hypothetical protein